VHLQVELTSIEGVTKSTNARCSNIPPMPIRSCCRVPEMLSVSNMLLILWLWPFTRPGLSRGAFVLVSCSVSSSDARLPSWTCTDESAKVYQHAVRGKGRGAIDTTDVATCIVLFMHLQSHLCAHLGVVWAQTVRS
jgi:hypothetical protein